MIKYRNMWAQVGLTIITLGIYTIYWYYSVVKEMLAHNGEQGNPGLWTVLSIIPIANLFAWWKFGGQVETMTGGKYNAVLIFLGFWVFSPIVWFVVQRYLNDLALGRGTTEPGTAQQVPYQRSENED